MDKASFSFGELLKAFRKRKSLSQKDLALSLGIHSNTISTWECGNYLPESKTVVLEIAYQLSLDEQETRQLLEASLTALAPHWGIPFPRNPFFTGREEILDVLHECLSPKRITTHPQAYALYGLGGVGKTQVALEYAYRYALEYSAVFWISTETIEQVIFSMRNIAEILNLGEQAETDPRRLITAVQRWLTTHNHWLLIWDNVSDPEILQSFFPPARQGALLLTTCHQAFGGLVRSIGLPPMTQEEGILFLLRRAKLAGRETPDEHSPQLSAVTSADYALAAELVTAMEGLPLALDQVGAYLEETGCNLKDYLQLYEQQRAYLLNRRGILGGNHPQSVAATFLLAMEKVEQAQKEAADLLRVCAFLPTRSIPEKLFLKGGADLGQNLGVMTTDLARFNQAIALLRSLSLVQRDAEAHTLSLHRLVQVVLQEHMRNASNG